MVAAVVNPERLIFIDECGTHTSLALLYGYAPRGERLYLSVPRNRGKNTTLLSSMSLEGMGASLTVEGATTYCRRHPRLLSTCGILPCRSTIVKRAVGYLKPSWMLGNLPRLTSQRLKRGM
jgi:hypothetical protein